MAKFKVFAVMTTDLYTIVDAVNETDALEQAERISLDGGFKEVGGFGSGSFYITRVEKVKRGIK